MEDKLYKKALFDKAIALHQEGKLDEADDIYKSVLRNDDTNFAANYLHGCILSDKLMFNDAIKYFNRALKSNPDSFEVNNNLGIVYKELGDTKNAEKYFLKAISIDKDNFQAYFNCANLYADIRNYDAAIEYLEKTVKLNDSFPEAYQRLGEMHQEKYKIDRNKEYLHKSIELFNNAITAKELYTLPEFKLSSALISLGLSNLWLGNSTEAIKCFNKIQTMDTTNQEVLADYIEKHLYNKKSISTLVTHEYEQLTFIDNDVDGIRNTKFTNEYYQELKSLYIKIKNDNFNINDLSSTVRLNIAKILYNKPPNVSPLNFINENNNIKKLESEYLNSKPEVLIVDNLLTSDALKKLQIFCRTANIFKYTHNGGYVGAYLSRGLANEFILKLSEDLKSTFKNIFNNLKLTQAWIYKYESSKEGVNVHADPAIVNVNFWITPDEANLDKKSGGLRIWNAIPPKEWNFEDYNSGKNVPKMKKFLSDNKSSEQVVPYKENRAVIFNSKLFHTTDTFNFNDKYEDRRVNVTLLYD